MKMFSRFMFSIAVLTGSFTGLAAQPYFNATNVDFGETLVNTTSSKSFKIYAPNRALNLKLFLSDTFIKVSTDEISIKTGDSAQIILQFSPFQNVSYKAALLISGNVSPGQWIIPVYGKGKLSDPYYNGTFDLYDEALKASLKQITGQNYVSLGYNSARDQMYGNLDNSGGYVTCAYTGRKAQFNTRSGATSNNFNCEHTWPQSMFSQNEPMRSDIHHLYSTDETANGKRDNDPFGVVSNPSWSVGGSKWANSVFEPRDEQKGNTARSMFYMAIRYQNYGSFLDGQEEILRQWNKSFLPDATAIKRNNDIYLLQKNRNPFVDHPAFADRMVSISKTANRSPVTKYFHTALLNGDNQIVTFERKNGDTTRVYFWNSGTADITVDSVSPPLNGQWIGSTTVVKPGAYFEIKLTEKDQSFMDKPYVIHLKGQTIYDTLRFVQSSAGTAISIMDHIDIYPNPTPDGKLTIKGIQATTLVQIWDTQGKRVFFTDIRPELNEIELTHLNNGIYFVHMLSGEVSRTAKVVIQK